MLADEQLEWCIRAKVSDYAESGTNDNVQIWFKFNDSTCCVTNVLDTFWKDDWCGPNNFLPKIFGRGCSPGDVNEFCGDKFLGGCNE